MKIVTYKNNLYLLRCVGLTPIKYVHIKKNTIRIRTEGGSSLVCWLTSKIENSQRQKRVLSTSMPLGIFRKMENRMKPQMDKEEFDAKFQNIFLDIQ